jgi:hypothetical protein
VSMLCSMRVTVPTGVSPRGRVDIEAILGVRDERIGPAVADVDRLVDEGVGLRGLLGDNADGPLEDVALLPRHPRSVTLDADMALPTRASACIPLVSGVSPRSAGSASMP